MKKLFLILMLAIPMQIFAQLLYYQITDENFDKKSKFYFVDNHETIWKINMKQNVKHFIKDLPFSTITSYTHVEERVSPKEYLITDDYIFFPNDKFLCGCRDQHR